jgi:two-component system osmolarity sensor histidine kinase EnvZ
LKLQLAMLPENKDTKAMKGDIQEMEKMIEGYLDFVRGEGDEEAQPVSLKAVTEKVTDAARRHGLNIESSVGRDVQLMLQAGRVRALSHEHYHECRAVRKKYMAVDAARWKISEHHY